MPHSKRSHRGRVGLGKEGIPTWNVWLKTLWGNRTDWPGERLSLDQNWQWEEPDREANHVTGRESGWRGHRKERRTLGAAEADLKQPSGHTHEKLWR